MKIARSDLQTAGNRHLGRALRTQPIAYYYRPGGGDNRGYADILHASASIGIEHSCGRTPA